LERHFKCRSLLRKGLKEIKPIVYTQKLRKIYKLGNEKIVALSGIDLTIEKGEFCCIAGPSGSGKSTLLNQLAGLEKPSRGDIFIGNHEISVMDENQLSLFRQKYLAFIFQSYNLLPQLTAWENVALPLMFKGIDKKRRMKSARKELLLMGLSDRINHKPSEMSGGQQQRVGIARAFVSEPKVIFADEPTGNLDSNTTHNVLFTILNRAKESDITIIMVTHEYGLTACADHIVTMQDGHIVNDIKQSEDTKRQNRIDFFADYIDSNSIIGLNKEYAFKND